MTDSVDKVIIQRLNKDGITSSAMVFTIRETVAEHNVMIEVLKKIRQDYPGAWYCMLEWQHKEQQQAQKKTLHQIEEVPISFPIPIEKIKEVTRSQLGLPEEDPIGDVPV